VVAYNKFNDFVEQLCKGVHQIGTHTFKVMLTNTAPAATNSVKADLTEISSGNGYSAGGSTTTVGVTESSGTATVTATDVTFTAAGGSIGPFRYVALYNDTPTSPADPLVAWWDRGSALTLADGESFVVDFGASLFTLA
jgi:hypothetical protein